MDLTRESAERIFALFQSRDIDAVLAIFAEDAIVFDPHYPVPDMRGKAAIRRGFAWAFGNMEKSGFTIRNFWPAAPGPIGCGAAIDSAAVEVDTHHVFRGGMRVDFPQVFVIETRDGLVIRLQSYVPYAPPGIGGLLAKLTRFVWRLRAWLSITR